LGSGLSTEERIRARGQGTGRRWKLVQLVEASKIGRKSETNAQTVGLKETVVRSYCLLKHEAIPIFCNQYKISLHLK
jgi:hypothetical protein